MTSDTKTTGLPHWLRVVVVGRRPKWTLIRVAVLVVATFVVFKFVLMLIRVNGTSMSPAYRDGAIHVVNRLAYRWHEPRRGDVVSIRLAGDHIMYMKRVIGLPGETIAFVRGQAVVNGQVLDEPYVKSPCNWEREPVTLGPDQYFVVGDNRSMSLEFHTHGLAARRRIAGKVLL